MYCSQSPVLSGVCVCVCVQVKRLLVRGNGEGRELQVHQRLMAGSTAGVIAQITIYPMEVGLSCACNTVSHNFIFVTCSIHTLVELPVECLEGQMLM